mmetsp:Transcript_26016/g.61690  ORF Transcript_26016/g.61690 Transcript_26016/m.61690 type:complete len:174 (+) Transcript_26016:1103-1624(+)
MKIFDRWIPFFNYSNLHLNIKKQKIFLSRKEIFNCFYKKRHLKNLNGYCCRVAIGKFRRNQNVYCIGVIKKFSTEQNLQDKKENFSHKKVFVNFGKMIRSFKVNFLSNSVPKSDEILDFFKKNLNFYSYFFSSFGVNRRKKILKCSKLHKSNKIRKIVSKTFFISGPFWDFSL